MIGVHHAAALVALVLVVGACSGGIENSGITVLAASSLTDVFEELIEAFNQTEVGSQIEVTLVLGGSSSLATQLEEGAPGDVVATADIPTMDRIVAADRVVGQATVFATNSLVIAVEPGNPLDIGGLADLEHGDTLVALCAPQVPCGALAEELLEDAAVTVNPATLEPSVRSVLAKLTLGEVDAGLVYRTDVVGLALGIVEPPRTLDFTTDYPIAALATDPHAQAFVDFVLSPAAAGILVTAEFGVAP